MMLILTLKTDSTTAELGLFEDKTKLDYQSFEAHRTLAENLHQKIEQLLKGHKFNCTDIEGIVCFEGPGSFTGLRIGLTLANTLAYSNKIPIVGSQSDDWLSEGLDKLLAGSNQVAVMPFYGSEPHITKQKK